ncbi:uncharacterized protein BX664DRAFT_382676 [Halteromyces radiatus]|uniref:uncharacterized protein n=1 Tax=Halteromyces radiatus TaxID=101107 RepID=UPI002220A7CE|nr:uncharacterized protein BX664DRAFT_382676 [Halteromyces radiatus]KAI8096190.1 hypothetical protein BX664DRAFT_382676 [Halteromyces radiatus]
MSKQMKSGLSESKSFSRHEKEMGLHLLYLPKTTVNVLSPSVPHETSHLYPKLAGANWTCYITGDTIRLGRAPENKASLPRNNNNKPVVDVDFRGSKQISRRHADIKFNVKKNCWELRVYGRIGVKVNHDLVTKKQRPVPLPRMAHLDIGGNSFVFVLPDNPDIKPGRNKSTLEPTIVPSTKTQSNSLQQDLLESEQDDQLASIITDIFESHDKTFEPTTQQIYREVVQQCRAKSMDYEKYTMDIILRALVLDSRFKVTEDSMELTMEQSDKAHWYWQRPPSSTPQSSSLDTTNTAGSWSDFGYDIINGGDNDTNETGERTTDTRSVISHASWPTSLNISNATSSESTGLSSIAPMTEILSIAEPNSTATIVSSPVTPSAYSITDNESTYAPAMSSTQSEHETTTTVRSNISSSIRPSPSTRTLSALSFTSTNENEPTLQSQSDKTEFTGIPLSSATTRTTRTILEPYYTLVSPDHFVGSMNSRGIGLMTVYSAILASQQQPGSTMDTSNSVTKPISLYSPTATYEDEDDGDDDDVYTFVHNRKRKWFITDQEDRDLWTRFRTTIFRAQP